VEHFLKNFFNRKAGKEMVAYPADLVLLLLGAILIFTASSGIAWALYPFL